MRIVPFLLSLLVTVILIILLSLPWGQVPPLGNFISPQHGFWLNAESSDKDHSLDIIFPQLESKVDVYLDKRLVPHIFAEKERDAYFVQGYLHAKYRLWQMEFQTHAAAGRLSEILGVGPDNAYLNNDRNMRRLGMVFGAMNSLEKMEGDPDTKSQLDAYTQGVNAYIQNISNSDLPFEYRLLNYLPENWTNLKTALFLKYMSFTLTGEEKDIELTNAKSVLSRAAYEELYPVRADSLVPIVPIGTSFDAGTVTVTAPLFADSLYFQWRDSVAITELEPDINNGSNNWAVNGSKTGSGRAILCNDPHLGVNLPSLWYEMQITTPEFSVYGVSFPGSPSIIIGFNDSIAWGVTNAMRDVRDYYQVEFKDNTKKEYLFNNEWRNSDLKIEEYKIKGKEVFRDTVAYTIFGPVMYDESFNGKGRLPDNKTLAVRWKAHDASNELKTFYKLNRAKNYGEYLEAIKEFVCPGQNFVFASKTNDIAIWQQAGFPAKWKRQGDFIMPGIDSAYMWKAEIPQNENPHLINPERGFVSSANQLPVDTTYPYYVGGHTDLYRGLLINRRLSLMSNITPGDMQALQNDNYNVFSETALPVLLSHIDIRRLSATEKRFLEIVTNWNKRNDPQEKGVAIFTSWFDSLEVEVWTDELERIPKPYDWPDEYTLIEALISDSAFRFIDNINTPQIEKLEELVTKAFKKAIPVLEELEKEGRLEWAKFKDSGIRHLLRMEPLSRFHLVTGGGLHVINATQQFHAPSWRMVVHLTDETEAYGVYPGGQSGNPGSFYYDSFVNDWAAGKYYSLWVMKKEDQASEKIAFKMVFTKN